jgi:hypothetical protein
MHPNPPREFRYERKFLVNEMNQHQVMSLVKRHPGLFYQPYPPRFINNFYLDTKSLAHYQDNVVGSMHRQKVRIRWYHDLFGHIQKPVLEFKIKQGWVGTKQQYPMAPFTLDNNFSHDDYEDLVLRSDLPPLVSQYMLTLDIALLNHYHRYYFATHDNRYRLTVDSGLTFHKVNRQKNSFLRKSVDHRTVIVEFKYSPEHDSQAMRISAFFPFGVTKSSKYVQGIERVYW